LAPRPDWGHKNTFGHVLVLGGSKGMPGAAILTSEAAMSAGPGLVTLSAPLSAFEQTLLMPEVMRHASLDVAHWTSSGMRKVLKELVSQKTIHAVALGPGLGREPETLDAVHTALEYFKADEQTLPVVLDADGLFALAQRKTRLNENFVITPHVGEAAQLLNLKGSEISADLLKAARLLRERFGCQVVLKSSSTVVALAGSELNHSEGCWLSPWGNSGMATAGSGDVLTGIIAAQLAQAFAQKRNLIWSVPLGVALHGLAGQAAVEKNTAYACHASDIRRALPQAFKSLQ
jgi:ADP-dependent NAD(P)H-hydrate dehydratase / NAD(P)H-hydrate epimerase